MYKMGNILSIVKANKSKRYESNARYGHHRASQLPQIGSKNTRALTQVRSTNDLSSIKSKASRMHRLQENLLLQTDLSTDLKGAVYEY